MHLIAGTYCVIDASHRFCQEDYRDMMSMHILEKNSLLRSDGILKHMQCQTCTALQAHKLAHQRNGHELMLM